MLARSFPPIAAAVTTGAAIAASAKLGFDCPDPLVFAAGAPRPNANGLPGVAAAAAKPPEPRVQRSTAT